jgi:integrase
MRPKERIMLRERKTGKEKWLNVQNGSLEALQKYANLVNLKYSDNHLFASRKGNRAISRVQAFKIIKDAGKQAGVKDIISCHSLRKTWGFHAYTKFNVSLDDIMLKLNHNSLSATKRYIGLNNDMLKQIESKVSF